jgi:hypothetical protein
MPELERAGLLTQAAQSFMAVLELHPAFGAGPLTRVGHPLFPDMDGYMPHVSGEVAQLLLMGGVYLGVAGHIDGPYHEKLWEILASADDVNSLLRQALTLKPLILPPRPTPEQLVDYLRDFAQRACLAGVRGALAEFASAVHAWRSTTHADGITGIYPPSGCAGDQIIIAGGPFGQARPARAGVLFPNQSGGCRGHCPAVVRSGDHRLGARRCGLRVRRLRGLRTRRAGYPGHSGRLVGG